MLVYDERIEKGIAQGLAALPEIRLAYVFGSRARGDARQDSDLDLGVLVDHLEPGLKLYGRVAEACSGWFPAEHLHIVVLNGAPPLLRHRVIRDGRCLYARDEATRVYWEVATLQEYFDTARWRELDNPGAKAPRKVDAQAFLAGIREIQNRLHG